MIQGYFDALAPKLAGRKVPDPILVGDFECPSGSGPVVCSSPEGAYSFQTPRGE